MVVYMCRTGAAHLTKLKRRAFGTQKTLMKLKGELANDSFLVDTIQRRRSIFREETLGS